MWVIVMGADATSKGAVVDYLTENRFEYIPVKAPAASASLVEREVEWGSRYICAHLQAQERALNHEVVTVRSIWEWGEIFPKMLLERGELTDDEARLIDRMYRPLRKQLPPPNAIIAMNPTKKMTIFDRQLLKGRGIDDKRLTTLYEAYSKFFEQIKIPVIELDSSEPLDRLRSSIEFGIASLRATKLTGQTLWKKELFHD